MKKLLIGLLALLIAVPLYAADTAMDSFTEDTSPDDEAYIIGYDTATATRWPMSAFQLRKANLTTIGGLTTADKTIIQWTGAGTAAVLTCDTANQLIGVNAANDALECKSTINIQMDDSAAQFKSATASKGTLKVLATSITDAKLVTITPVCTDNCTITTESYGAVTKTIVDKDTAQTLTNKTLTTPAITFDEVLIRCTGEAAPSAFCTAAGAGTLTAANVSRTMLNTYGRDEAQTITLPTAAEGMTFIVVVGTQHDSAFTIAKGASAMYFEVSGAPHGVAAFIETNQAVGSRASCATFQTAAATWSWLCGSVSGTWTHTDL
jgi:hypothetical protein